MIATVAAVAGAAVLAAVVLLAAAARPHPSRPAPPPPPGPPSPPPTADLGQRHRRVVILVAVVLAAGLPTALVCGPVAAALLVAAAVGGDRLRRRAEAARARREIAEAMPDTVELLVLCVRAGRTPRQAIGELAAHAPPAVREAFAEVDRWLHRGRSLADALDELPRLLGSPGRLVATAVAGAERDGLPLAPVLDRLADEARAGRRRLGEIEARRIPVRLTFPLVCCTLPSFVLLTIAPAVLAAVSSLRSPEP